MKKPLVVGVLFIIGLLALAVITVVLTDWTGKGYDFHVRFQNVSGLDKERPVFYHGYKIGKIKNIEWESRGTLLVTIRILEDVNIPNSAEFEVEDSSIFGGKQLTIYDPDPLPAPFIPIAAGGEPLEGMGQAPPFIESLKRAIRKIENLVDESSVDLRAALNSIREAMDKVNQGDGTIAKMINDPAVYNELQEVLENLNTLTGELSDQEFTDDIKGAADSLNRVLKQIEEAQVGQVIEKVGSAMETADSVLTRIETGPGSVHRLIYDEELIRNLEVISGRIARGEGAVGKLFTEDGLYNKMESLMVQAGDVLEKAQSEESTVGLLLTTRELHDKALEAVEKLTRAAEDISETLGVAARTWVSVGLAYRQTFQQELGIGKMFIRLIPRESRYFLVGGSFLNPTGDGVKGPIIFDEQDQDEGKSIFEVDVQIAQLFFANRDDLDPWNDVTVGVRGGVIEGKVGGGIDIDFLRAFRLTVEARDTHRDEGRFDEQIDRFLLRSELSIQVWKYFRVYAGMDNIVEDAGFLVGASVEWTDDDIKGLVSLLATAF